MKGRFFGGRFTAGIGSLLSVLLASWLVGCSTVPATAPVPAAMAPEYWWSAHFYLPWTGDREPDWYLDAMLAGEVVAPALKPRFGTIPLWRFRRRAGSDASGHNFSLLFRSTPAVAAQVFAAMQARPALAALQGRGRVLRVAFDDPARPPVTAAIEATSDPAWPLELQRGWPYYIMGVSRTWLDLIEQSVARQQRPPDEAVYRQAQDEVSRLWETWGRHAFLHHLNAVFAYQPFLVAPDTRVRF